MSDLSDLLDQLAKVLDEIEVATQNEDFELLHELSKQASELTRQINQISGN